MQQWNLYIFHPCELPSPNKFILLANIGWLPTKFHMLFRYFAYGKERKSPCPYRACTLVEEREKHTRQTSKLNGMLDSNKY